MDAHLSKQFWGPMALSGSSWKRWIAKPWGQSQRYLAAYLYIFQTNVELETLFSTITKGDGELDGISLDSTWSRFERNTGKHMQRYTWPYISCTRKIHGKTIVKPFFCTISRMKLEEDFLKNLTIIKNTIMRDQKNEWVTRFETSRKKKSFFRCVYYFQCSRNLYSINVLTRKLTSIVNKFYPTRYSGRIKVKDLYGLSGLAQQN